MLSSFFFNRAIPFRTPPFLLITLNLNNTNPTTTNQKTMPRMPRIHYPGAFYHVILRGNAREDIFFSKNDRDYFYVLLNETVLRYKYRLHGFCLMTNHVHLIIEVGNVPLSKIMQNISFRYARYINQQLNRVGHLFQGRYKAILVEAENYLLVLIKYVHLNPIRAHMVMNLEDYLWSSHHAYVSKKKISFLTTDIVLGFFSSDRFAAQNLYLKFLLDDNLNESSQKEFQVGNQKSRSILCGSNFLENLNLNENIPVEYTFTLEQIINFICSHYGVTKYDLQNISRKHLFSKIRASAAWLTQQLRICTLTNVACYFHKDVSTLAEAINRLTCNEETLTELELLLHLVTQNPLTQA